MIKAREIKDKTVTIYNPDGSVLCVTDNLLVFTDIRLQIKMHNASGYKVELDGKMHEIKPNGRINPYPAGLFDTYVRLTTRLLN